MNILRRRALEAGPSQGPKTSEVSPSGIGCRGSDHRQTGRRCERHVENRVALTVGGHLQRSQVVLGLPRSLGRIAGAGKEVDAIGRLGRVTAQPALEPAVSSGDDDGEILKVVRSLARCIGVVGDAITAQVDGFAAAIVPGGKIAVKPRQRAVVVVGCQVKRRLTLCVVEGIVGLEPRRRAGRCRADVLAYLAGRQRVAPNADIVDLSNEAIPAPGCGRPVLGKPVPDLIEAVREVLRRSRHGSEEPTVEVQRHGPGRAIDDEGHVVPLSIVDGAIRYDLLDRAESRVIRPAVELAVGTDIERRNPSVGWIDTRAPPLIAEDDTPARGLEPGLEGLARLGAVDQAVGQADVVRAVELDSPDRAGRGRVVVAEDAVGGDLVADRAGALDINAGRRIVGDQVAGGGGGPSDGVTAGAGQDLNPETVGLRLRSARIRTDVVGFDRVAGRARSRDQDPRALREVVDVEAADRDAGAGDGQAACDAGLAPAQLDQRCAAKAWLGKPVDQDRPGDRGQG